MTILPLKMNHFQVECDLYGGFEAHPPKKFKKVGA